MELKVQRTEESPQLLSRWPMLRPGLTQPCLQFFYIPPFPPPTLPKRQLQNLLCFPLHGVDGPFRRTAEVADRFQPILRPHLVQLVRDVEVAAQVYRVRGLVELVWPADPRSEIAIVRRECSSTGIDTYIGTPRLIASMTLLCPPCVRNHPVAWKGISQLRLK